MRWRPKVVKKRAIEVAGVQSAGSSNAAELAHLGAVLVDALIVMEAEHFWRREKTSVASVGHIEEAHSIHVVGIREKGAKRLYGNSTLTHNMWLCFALLVYVARSPTTGSGAKLLLSAKVWSSRFMIDCLGWPNCALAALEERQK